MKNYVETLKEFLKEFLKERRNISRNAYRFMSKAYRRVAKGIMTWDDVIDILGGAR